MHPRVRRTHRCHLSTVLTATRRSRRSTDAGAKEEPVARSAKENIVKAWFDGVETTLTFSRKEDELSVKILTECAEMYEAMDIDATPIRNLINKITERVTWQ